MSVKAFFIHRAAGQSQITHHLLSLTGPHLFRAEAEGFAHAIFAATGIECVISTIEVSRMLGQAIQINDRFIVKDVWKLKYANGKITGEIYYGDDFIRVRREEEKQMWAILEAERKSCDVVGDSAVGKSTKLERLVC